MSEIMQDEQETSRPRGAGFFEGFFLSFFDRGFYARARYTHGGKAALFLLAVAAIVAILTTFRAVNAGSELYDEGVKWYEEAEFGEIRIENGVVSADDVKQPFIVEVGASEGNPGIPVIVDTTGEITSLDDYEQGILLTDSKIIYKENPQKTEQHDLSKIKNFAVSTEALVEWKSPLTRIVGIALFLVMLVWCVIARLVHALIAGGIASGVSGRRTSFSEGMKMAIFALFPASVAGLILAYFSVPWILASAMYVTALIALTIYGAKSSVPAAEDQESPLAQDGI